MVDRLDWRTFMSASPDTPPDTITALDAYFSRFVAVPIKPGEDGAKPEVEMQACVGCGKVLTGLLGTWRWGIAHGAGECSACGWPSRGHHFITDAAGEGIATLRYFILQEHPDFVDQRPRSAVADRERENQQDDPEANRD